MSMDWWNSSPKPALSGRAWLLICFRPGTVANCSVTGVTTWTSVSLGVLP